MPCCNGPKCCKNFDDDREGVSDADVARFGGDSVGCPECGAELYHDASQCHACGYAITSASLKREKRWVPVVAGVLVLGLVYFMFRGLM